MVKMQTDYNREVKGKTKEPSEPSEEHSEPQEGRKLYATKFGAKYHFNQGCNGFNDNPNF